MRTEIFRTATIRDLQRGGGPRFTEQMQSLIGMGGGIAGGVTERTGMWAVGRGYVKTTPYGHGR